MIMKVVINNTKYECTYNKPTYILELKNNSKLLSENKKYKFKILKTWCEFINNKKKTKALIIIKTTDKFLLSKIKKRYISTP